MNTIFLIGMPGAGKSHWGRIWGNEYGYKEIDLDANIEARAGISITDIFSGIGEPGFRSLEAEVLLETISAARAQNTIIVTGGGTPIFNSNMDIMLGAGCVIYLRADTGILMSNILADDNSRPLLKDGNLKTMEAMLNARKSFYERAHFIFDVEKISTDTFAEILKACTSLQ